MYVDVRDNADAGAGSAARVGGPGQRDLADAQRSGRDAAPRAAGHGGGAVARCEAAARPPPSLRHAARWSFCTIAREAARFNPGDLLYIVTVAGEGELTTARQLSPDGLMLSRPLGRDYTAATIGIPCCRGSATPRDVDSRPARGGRARRSGAPSTASMRTPSGASSFRASRTKSSDRAITSPGRCFRASQTRARRRRRLRCASSKARGPRSNCRFCARNCCDRA